MQSDASALPRVGPVLPFVVQGFKLVRLRGVSRSLQDGTIITSMVARAVQKELLLLQGLPEAKLVEFYVALTAHTTGRPWRLDAWS